MDNEDFKHLIKACCDGDKLSRQIFQDAFGKLIYFYPSEVFKTDKDIAGDFYLYVFDKNRIFRRLATFRGDGISGENFLRYIVLRDLSKEWLRYTSDSMKKTEEMDAPDSPYAHDRYNGDEEKTPAENPSAFSEKRKNILSQLEQGDFFILKMYYLYDLTGASFFAEEIRSMAAASGKPILDVITFISRLQKKLAQKAEKKAEIRKSRDIAFYRRLLFQTELVKIEEDIAVAEMNRSFELGAMKAKRDALRVKILKRIRQTDRIAEKNPDAVITTPYKDIADFLGTTVGAVSGKIARAKAQFVRMLQEENNQTHSERD